MLRNYLLAVSIPCTGRNHMFAFILAAPENHFYNM